MPRSGIWKGSLSFGLLNIPVVLQTASEERQIHFSMLDGDDLAPIKFRRINANTGKEVPYPRIVKGYQYEPGQYVIVDRADFSAANPKATNTIDIENFVLVDDIDTMLFDKPYYLVPQKSGEKGYFLLHRALKKTRKVAIGKIVIRTKQHLAAVMPRGDYLILQLLRFAHEVRQVHEVDYLSGHNKNVKLNERELKMAEQLVESMSEDWRPDQYKDTYYDDLMRRIRMKIKRGESHIIESADKIAGPPAPSKVVDLLPLLRQSLKQKKSLSRIHKTKEKRKDETAG